MNMKKKIAFYIESLVVGGAEKVLIDLVNHMDLGKFDITVISIFKNSVYDQYCYQFDNHFVKHIKYKYLIDNGIKWKYFLFNYLFHHINKKLIYRTLVREKFDIEIAFYEGLPTELVASSVNKKSVKLAWLHTNQKRLYENLPEIEKNKIENLYQKFNSVVAVSSGVKKSFETFFSTMTVNVLYNPVNISQIRQKAKENILVEKGEATLFVAIGRLISIKGYERLINVFSQLKKEGYEFQFWLIGDGSEGEYLSKLIDKRDLKDEVIMLGHQTNPYCYLKKSDYLVCSSYEEGFSTVVLEAMALGIPVITTNCTGMKDIFGGFECGIICENSQEGLKQAIVQVLNQNRKEIYANNALKRIGKFSIANRIKALEEFLNGFS